MPLSFPPKASLLSLPPELLLHIAHHFIDDYLFWRSSRFKHLRKATASLHLCTYVCLAKTHPFLCSLLLGTATHTLMSKQQSSAREKRRYEESLYDQHVSPADFLDACIFLNMPYSAAMELKKHEGEHGEEFHAREHLQRRLPDSAIGSRNNPIIL